jgi:hypothetical protein
MSNQIFVGDIGTQIIVDTGEALASATVLQLKIKKPDGTKVTKTATITETTKLLYSTIAGDLNLAGEYIVQAYVELPGWKGHGLPVSFNVSAIPATS